MPLYHKQHYIFNPNTPFTLLKTPSSDEDRWRRFREMRLPALGPVVARTNVLVAVNVATPHFFSCGRFCFKDTLEITIVLRYSNNLKHVFRQYSQRLLQGPAQRTASWETESDSGNNLSANVITQTDNMCLTFCSTAPLYKLRITLAHQITPLERLKMV